MQSGFQYLYLHLLIRAGTQNHHTSKLQRNAFLASGWEELFTRQGTPK